MNLKATVGYLFIFDHAWCTLQKDAVSKSVDKVHLVQLAETTYSHNFLTVSSVLKSVVWIFQVGLLLFGVASLHAAPSPDHGGGGGHHHHQHHHHAPVADQYAAPSYEPQCHEECSTHYETQYDQQCETSYEQKCETRYETQYESKCHDHYETTYEQQCETTYENECHTT